MSHAKAADVSLNFKVTCDNNTKISRNLTIDRKIKETKKNRKIWILERTEIYTAGMNSLQQMSNVNKKDG